MLSSFRPTTRDSGLKRELFRKHLAVLEAPVARCISIIETLLAGLVVPAWPVDDQWLLASEGIEFQGLFWGQAWGLQLAHLLLCLQHSGHSGGSVRLRCPGVRLTLLRHPLV